MGEHQRKLWDHMMAATEDYLAGEIGLRRLIAMLQGSLDAAELKEQKLVKEFYEHWTPLETEYAYSLEMGSNVDVDRVRQFVEGMRHFLIRTRERAEAYDPRK